MRLEGWSLGGPLIRNMRRGRIDGEEGVYDRLIDTRCLFLNQYHEKEGFFARCILGVTYMYKNDVP